MFARKQYIEYNKDQKFVPSPIVPSCKYVHAYQWHVPLRCSEPNPMLLLLNHSGARRSNSYQQALSAQSTPPRKHQLLEDVNFAAYVLQKHIAEPISVQNANREINQKVHWGCTGCCDLESNLSTFLSRIHFHFPSTHPLPQFPPAHTNQLQEPQLLSLTHQQ
ncbi:hypothetical protein V8G54_014765 [Vigna mungo]|uniref:Uncharacterized protein n=1 Tax=Vigna mungo TaxID=3915 RepID=A0AAQ3NI87_VIGMU